MSKSLSPNTQAILLLTAPLIVGRGAPRDRALRPLTLKREYSVLAKRLHEVGREPADLLGAAAGPLLDECLGAGGPGLEHLERGRIESLLGRGLQLSLAVERWETRAIWVLSRADSEYPGRLKGRLGQSAPPILYGCGDRSFLNGGGLAIVGPRDAREDLLDYAREIGELAAAAGRAVVSGGARGIDRTAMGGALAVDGRSIGVVANDLARAATQRDNRDALVDGRLLLVSPYDPAARFLAGHAMERNHSVYGLADAALVVDALVGQGGTRAGAAAQLARRSSCPVYVRSTRGHSDGLAALEALGALPWPNPQRPEEFGKLLEQSVVEIPAPGEQRTLVGAAGSSTLAETRSSIPVRQYSDADKAPVSAPSLADELWQAVRINAWRFCEDTSGRDAIAAAFDLTGQQAREWLVKLVEEGVLRRENRPVRYLAIETCREEMLIDEHGHAGPIAPVDELWTTFSRLARGAVVEPRSIREVADELGIQQRQAQRWLMRLAQEGGLNRSEGPVRYSRPPGLLDGVGPLPGCS